MTSSAGFVVSRIPRYFSLDRMAVRCSCLAQQFAICLDLARRTGRDHATIFRETTID